MSWSYVKPEFLGKPEEDPEAHVLRMINWMDTQNFAPDKGLQRFPFTLAGKTRLWYQSIHQFQDNGEELQDRYRMQFSKIGNPWR